MKEFPKMLYRSNKLPGTSEVFNSGGVFCAVAVDADEQKDMLSAGFRLTVAAPEKPKRKAKVKAEIQAED